MRALLVEDDQTIADFVARGLREAGFTVDRAADGDDGLQLATTGTYDVAIIGGGDRYGPARAARGP